MRCCETWKHIEDCFDTLSFECIDFQRLSQLVKTFRHVKLAEVSSVPWTQTEKDIALIRCRSGQRAWRNKKLVLSLSAVTDEKGTPWIMKMNLEEDFVSIGETFSRHAKKARDITNMKIFCDMFNTLLMTSVGLLIKLNLMNSLH